MPKHLPPERRKPLPEYGYYKRLHRDHQVFVDEYLIDMNAAAAALRSGYQNPQVGLDLLNSDDIKAAVHERREMLTGERVASGALFVLGKVWDVATADARELVEHWRVPCRYCWGLNGQYQFTKSEADRLLRAHEYGHNGTAFEALWPAGNAEYAYYIAGKEGLPFDAQGGDGYTSRRDPNQTCSECHGLGISMHFIADTRKLSPAARQLYRGVRIGQGKIEILMANQDAARDILAKHYNVGVEKKELFVRTADPRTLSEEELAQGTAELEAIIVEGEFKRIEGEPEERVAAASDSGSTLIATRRLLEQAGIPLALPVRGGGWQAYLCTPDVRAHRPRL